jgi:hypothetical protein
MYMMPQDHMNYLLSYSGSQSQARLANGHVVSGNEDASTA